MAPSFGPAHVDELGRGEALLTEAKGMVGRRDAQLFVGSCLRCAATRTRRESSWRPGRDSGKPAK